MADDPLDAAGTKGETGGAGDDWAAALSEHEGSGGIQHPAFAELGDSAAASPAGNQNLEFLLDIPLDVTVELGRTRMIINKMLQLTQGRWSSWTKRPANRWKSLSTTSCLAKAK